MTDEELTLNLKLIVGALGCMDQHSVSKIITLGGVECSRSRADAILRGAGAVNGRKIPRAVTVTPDEFHAFCVGLKPFIDTMDATG